MRFSDLEDTETRSVTLTRAGESDSWESRCGCHRVAVPAEVPLMSSRLSTTMLKLFALVSTLALVQGLSTRVLAQPAATPTTALINGRWFNGQSFDSRTMYSVDGRFTSRKPAHVDRTIDLADTWIVPPFADAHSHTIGKGVEDADRKAIHQHLTDGVFYLKIQANLPLTDEMRRRLPINHADSLDVIFAGAPLTATGGRPTTMHEIQLKRGMFPGYTNETLRDHTYFAIDSESDLEQKWPRIVSLESDFIKTILTFSDEFEKRRGQELSGLDPRLLPRIVEKAHAAKLRVSTHVANNADFHAALVAGVDEVAHLPVFATTSIALDDAKLAGQRRIVVDTTCGQVSMLPRRLVPEADIPKIVAAQKVNLRQLYASGVQLAIGSDLIESPVKEIAYLRDLDVFDNLTLIKLWTESTAHTIFPNRKIGRLAEGYEANFVALEGNPLDSLDNVRRIKLRFKQGAVIQP